MNGVLFTSTDADRWPMPGGPNVHGRLEKLTLSLPTPLASEIAALVKDTGYWLSSVDFIREATIEKLERWKKDHPPESR
jgi:metal-responsive CopG/Arc/MetJ family transcriptional regulator